MDFVSDATCQMQVAHYQATLISAESDAGGVWPESGAHEHMVAINLVRAQLLRKAKAYVGRCSYVNPCTFVCLSVIPIIFGV